MTIGQQVANRDTYMLFVSSLGLTYIHTLCHTYVNTHIPTYIRTYICIYYNMYILMYIVYRIKNDIILLS